MASSSKPIGARGVSWRERETEALLAIWSEEKIQRALTANHKNINVYERITREMHAQGHKRSAQECRTKTKGLCGNYRRCVTQNTQTGRSPVFCPYYNVLDCILKNDRFMRPAVIKKSYKMQFHKANKENMPNPGSEDMFGMDLQTINTADLRTSTPESTPGSSCVNIQNTFHDQSLPAEDPCITDKSMRGGGRSNVSLSDDGDEEEGCATERRGAKEAVLSEQEGGEGDSSAEERTVSPRQQKRDEK